MVVVNVRRANQSESHRLVAHRAADARLCGAVLSAPGSGLCQEHAGALAASVCGELRRRFAGDGVAAIERDYARHRQCRVLVVVDGYLPPARCRALDAYGDAAGVPGAFVTPK